MAARSKPHFIPSAPLATPTHGTELRDPAATYGAPVSSPRDGKSPLGAGTAAPQVILLGQQPPMLEPLLAPHDLAGLHARIEALARRPGVTVDRLGAVDGCPLVALQVAPRGPATLEVIVTAGVHGVEPAGPAAALLFASEALQQCGSQVGIGMTIVPLINPFGYRTCTRGNAAGLDLNRCFSACATVPYEVAALRSVLGRKRYDLGVDLHSSRSAGHRGFFALHRGAAPVLAWAMARFSERYPVLRESTERYELESAGVLRSCNRGTIKDYLGDTGTRWAVTIEAPALWPYEQQVRGTAEILHTLVDAAVHIKGTSDVRLGA